MVGSERGPFWQSVCKLWFSWMSETWSMVCINIELRIFECGKVLEDGDKSPIKPVCHKRCHCHSRYGILWKGSVDHKTCSSNLCDFLSLLAVLRGLEL